MLRSVVIGAKQLMFDKVLNVKNLHQLEIRLTRCRNLGILIATERRGRLDIITEWESAQAALSVLQKRSNPTPKRQKQNQTTKQASKQTTAIFLDLKVRVLFRFLALQFDTGVHNTLANVVTLAEEIPKLGTAVQNLRGSPGWEPVLA